MKAKAIPTFKVIAEVLRQREMPVLQLAEKAGVHPNTLYRFLHGRQDLLSGNLDRVMRVLGLHVCERREGA